MSRKALDAKRKFGLARALMTPEHPVVQQIFETIKTSDLSVDRISAAAGCDPGAIYKWAHRGPGNFTNVEAVLRVLGFRLIVEPIKTSGWRLIDGFWVAIPRPTNDADNGS